MRNVPDEVAERLERMAHRAGLSMSAFAVRELAEIARQADNAALLAELPDVGISAEDILSDLATGRGGR